MSAADASGQDPPAVGEQATSTEAPVGDRGRRPGDPALPGPFPVGEYAAGLREFLRGRPRILIQGEVTNLRIPTRGANAFFELRDGDGGVPCAIWRDELDRLDLPSEALRDGVEAIVAGGPDFYPGSRQSSPGFAFRATWLRPAGEGDLLARLEELRRRLRSEGLFEPQSGLRLEPVPKAIGVVTSEQGEARRDLLAGLERRGWRGTLIWAFTPVQDRHAAPAITAAIQDLAARPEVDAIVVCRGGGSLADLWAFCDETLCRTVAMVGVPVISAVGHHRDQTLLDDVAAVSCSTPTHAAEAAVPIDCGLARGEARTSARRLQRAAETAISSRAGHLAALARVPGRALASERQSLNQLTREMRASGERGIAERERYRRRIAVKVLDRAARRAGVEVAESRGALGSRAKSIGRAAEAALSSRRQGLRRAESTLRGHDPERTLERGYALIRGSEGETITGYRELVGHRRVVIEMHGGSVPADLDPPGRQSHAELTLDRPDRGSSVGSAGGS